jgi:hypothetical protein
VLEQEEMAVEVLVEEYMPLGLSKMVSWLFL